MGRVRVPSSVTLAAALACGVPAATPAAAQQHDAEARDAFTAGKKAYEAKQYDAALADFQRCYTLSGEPALLYNISSSFQAMNRPGEAADALRDYLKARPSDPNAAELARRITTLRKAQELIDAENTRKAAEAERLKQEQAARRDAGWLAVAETDRKLEFEHLRDQRRRRRIGLIAGVTIGSVVVVGGIITGVLVGLGKCSPKEAHDFDYGRMSVTP